MNERQEQTADVLGKLTVLGTIVLPLNIICGMWGMNVKVPGQDVDSLTWFWSSKNFFFLFFFLVHNVPYNLMLTNHVSSYGGNRALCLYIIPYCEASLQDCIDFCVVLGRSISTTMFIYPLPYFSRCSICMHLFRILALYVGCLLWIGVA